MKYRTAQRAGSFGLEYKMVILEDVEAQVENLEYWAAGTKPALDNLVTILEGLCKLAECGTFDG